MGDNKVFPPDQDLGPGDKSFATFIEPRHSANEARRIVQGIRQSYGDPCDLIIMAVPATKGRPFLEGLAMALEAQGKLAGREGI